MIMLYLALVVLVSLVSILVRVVWRLNEARISELKEQCEKRVSESFLSGQNDIRGKIRTFCFRAEQVDKKLLGLLQIKIQSSLVIVTAGDDLLTVFGDFHRLRSDQLTPEVKKLLLAIIGAITPIHAAAAPFLS